MADRRAESASHRPERSGLRSKTAGARKGCAEGKSNPGEGRGDAARRSESERREVKMHTLMIIGSAMILTKIVLAQYRNRSPKNGNG
jgi:hypothetical protein